MSTKKNNQHNSLLHTTKRYIQDFFRTFLLKKEIYLFMENFSALLSAGLTIPDAFATIQEEMESQRMKRIVVSMQAEIDNGSSLSHAFEHARILPNHMLSLVRLGELSGNLTDNLKIVVLQNEKEELFRSRIRSSLSYAVIVTTLAIVVGVGTATFTLPRMADFFSELDAELPFITRVLIAIGEFLSQYGFIFIPLFVGILVVMVYFLFSFPKTKFVGHSLLFHTPIIKTIIKQAELARFGFLLGTMLKAGMPASEALHNMPDTTTFLNYRSFYLHLEKEVSEGNSFRKSFASYPHVEKIFPAAVRQMLSAAEQSGSLSETFLRIGKLYETKVEATARNLPIILEPIIIILIGLMVGTLALGVILPIYNIGAAL